MHDLASELVGRRVAASDGDVGRIEDLFIDDERWVVRFLVVDTGTWLSSRRVLLSPASAAADAPALGPLPVALTREQIERSPDVDTHKPVSREYEIAHSLHYGYDNYWTGPMLWGATMLPTVRHGMVPAVLPGLVRPPMGPARSNTEAPSAVQELAQQAEEAAQRSHLRSAREILSYRVDARDGGVGCQALVARWSCARAVVDGREH